METSQIYKETLGLTILQMVVNLVSQASRQPKNLEGIVE